MAGNELELKDYREVGATKLGQAYSEIVLAPENEGLFTDFPGLKTRYSDPEIAVANVAELINDIKHGIGAYAAYAAMFGEDVGGAVSAGQDTLRTGLLRRRTVAEGPLIAYWLDERRPPERRRVGNQLTRKLASKLIGHKAMHGFAWTVVRPENTRSIGVLQAEDNGFGGFVPVDGEPKAWDVGDGVEEPRWLYVARMSMQQIRESANSQA